MSSQMTTGDTHYMDILCVVFEDGPVSMRWLAETLGMSRKLVQKLIDDLIAIDLVETISVSDDGRITKRWELTREGCQEAIGAHEEYLARKKERADRLAAIAAAGERQRQREHEEALRVVEEARIRAAHKADALRRMAEAEAARADGYRRIRALRNVHDQLRYRVERRIHPRDPVAPLAATRDGRKYYSELIAEPLLGEDDDDLL